MDARFPYNQQRYVPALNGGSFDLLPFAACEYYGATIGEGGTELISVRLPTTDGTPYGCFNGPQTILAGGDPQSGDCTFEGPFLARYEQPNVGPSFGQVFGIEENNQELTERVQANGYTFIAPADAANRIGIFMPSNNVGVSRLMVQLTNSGSTGTFNLAWNGVSSGSNNAGVLTATPTGIRIEKSGYYRVAMSTTFDPQSVFTTDSVSAAVDSNVTTIVRSSHIHDSGPATVSDVFEAFLFEDAPLQPHIVGIECITARACDIEATLTIWG